MKKNGFTLIELLAVIILIGLLSVLIVSKVNSSIGDSSESTYYASSISLVKRLEEYFFEQKMKGTFTGCIYDFTNNDNSCDGFTFSGDAPNNGSITMDEYGNINGNLEFKQYNYEIINNDVIRR